MRTPYGETRPDATTLIRKVRKEKGWTLEDLAASLKVTRQTVQRWEVDDLNITVKNLIRCANAMETPVRSLLPGDDGLTAEERAMLEWWRSAAKHERRVVSTLTNSLAEARQPDFEIEKTGSD